MAASGNADALHERWEDLNQAAKIATREMLNFIVETKGRRATTAFMLLSAAMDLPVTNPGPKACMPSYRK